MYIDYIHIAVCILIPSFGVDNNNFPSKFNIIPIDELLPVSSELISMNVLSISDSNAFRIFSVFTTSFILSIIDQWIILYSSNDFGVPGIPVQFLFFIGN